MLGKKAVEYKKAAGGGIMRQVGVDIRKGREIGRMLSVGEEKRGCKHRIGWIKEEKEQRQQ